MPAVSLSMSTCACCAMPVLPLGSNRVTLTSLSGALTKRAGNWPSPVIKRLFFPGCSTLLNSATWISKAVPRPANVQCWYSGSCCALYSLPPVLQPPVQQLDDKHPAKYCSSHFQRLQHNAASLRFTGFSLPGEGESPR